jgi:hypothetical protein
MYVVLGRRYNLNFLNREEELEEAKDPGQTDGDADRDVHSQFLATLLTVSFRSTFRAGSARAKPGKSLSDRANSTVKGLANFATDEEEQDSVRGHDDEARDEEADESSNSIVDIAAEELRDGFGYDDDTERRE